MGLYINGNKIAPSFEVKDPVVKKILEGSESITAKDLEGVTKFRDYAFYRSNLKSIELPSTLTNLGQYSFQLSDLSEIKFPNNITSLIGYSAFRQCFSLKKLNLPSSLKSIGSYMFYSSGIQEIDWGDTSNLELIDTNAFASCKFNSSLVLPAKLKELGAQAFYGSLANATEFYLPDGFENVVNSSSSGSVAGKSKFSTLYNNIYYLPSRDNPYFLADLKEVAQEHEVIHKDCKVIGSAIYYGTSSIKTVTIEEGSQLRSVSDYAFYNNTEFESINLPDTIEFIGHSAFGSCSKLSNIGSDLSNVTRFEYGAFRGCSALPAGSINLSKNNKYIDDQVFEYCGGISSFEVDDTIEYLGHSIFSGAANLETIIVNSKPQSFSSYSGPFTNLAGLKNLYWNCEPWDTPTDKFFWYTKDGNTNNLTLTVGDNVNVFSTRSFGYVGGTAYMDIVHAIFGSNIKEIQGYWGYQRNLQTITLKTSVPPILEQATFRAFDNDNASQLIIYIPRGSLQAYQEATNWSNYAERFVEIDM